jgi:tRNA(fMet)-specific endonuclease VapC
VSTRVVVDTNAWTALQAGDQRIAAVLNRAQAVLLTPVVIGELLDGFKGGKREDANRDLLDRFRAKPRTVCLPITDETAEWFAQIKQHLKRSGKPIPLHDVWIAASCLEHGASLSTLDAHFGYVAGLRLCRV